MRTSLRTELYKALHNRMFFSALGIGIIISLINVVQCSGTVQEYTNWLPRVISEGRSMSTSYIGFSLFINWMGTNLISFSRSLFFFIWPVLAAMPYGWSYSSERRSGYYNQVASRSSRKRYFCSKYIAVFVSGGLAVAVPLLFDLLANALVSPDAVPDGTLMIQPISNGCFLSGLYYTHPWVFALIWCFVDFLWGGVAACTCFLVGAKIRLQVIVMLVPFMIFVLLDGLNTTVRRFMLLYQTFSPLQLAQPITMSANPGWVVFSVMGVLFLLTVTVGYWQVVKHELA